MDTETLCHVFKILVPGVIREKRLGISRLSILLVTRRRYTDCRVGEQPWQDHQAPGYRSTLTPCRDWVSNGHRALWFLLRTERRRFEQPSSWFVPALFTCCGTSLVPIFKLVITSSRSSFLFPLNFARAALASNRLSKLHSGWCNFIQVVFLSCWLIYL